jgi:hypothetical protein
MSKWTAKAVEKDMEERRKSGDFGEPASWADLYEKVKEYRPEPPKVRSALWNSEEPTAANPQSW